MKPIIGSCRIVDRTGTNYKIFYRIILYSLAITTVALHSAAVKSAGAASTLPEAVPNYSRLVELIRLEDKVKPVYVFNDFEETIDKTSIKYTKEYLSNRKDLIRKIRRDLGGGALKWKLDNFIQRLVFVPETRDEYATL